jgi:hypothetical protein
MLTGNFVKVERILSGVYRDFGHSAEIDWIECVEWIGECLSLIGSAAQYVEKVTDGNTDLYHADPIVIENYRGRLPSDIVFVQQAWDCENNAPLAYSTDTFHTAYYCEGFTKCCNGCKDTYKLNDGYIFTSFETGKVLLAYKSFPTDEEGLPLIPDNQSFIEACKWYVMEKLALRLLSREKMNFNVYNIYDQNKAWYVGKAQVQAVMPNYDQMENIQNMFLRLMPNIQANRDRYKSIGKLEQRFHHNLNR